jgi:uncharacterized protein (DUF362 family)
MVKEMIPKVILKHCESYDPQRIKAILLDGMDELGVRPQGRTLIKPNLVMPHKRYFSGCYTRPEFMDGLIDAIKTRGEGITDLAIGERSGITIPSRYAFAEAGYLPVLRKHRVRAEYFDEKPSVQFPLKHPQALRSFVYIPQAITKSDFLVNAPKFKIHAWMKVTFALKNLIGIQDDAHRLIDHDFTLPSKIVDLQEVIQPGFIAIDGIEAGEYSEIAPSSFPLHLIVMGINPVAVDAVCTHIVGLDPLDVEYIRLASARGYGPIDLDEIEILGDVPLAEAQKRAEGIRLGGVRVDQFLEKSRNLRVYLGPPPQRNYCPGGCPGAVLEAIQIVEVFQPKMREEIRPLSFIIGGYQGEIIPQPREKIVALGDCACWSGTINGFQVHIPSIYKPHSQRDPHKARAKDALRKSIDIMATILRQNRQPVVVVRGCPVPVLEITNILSLMGGTTNPSMNPDILPRFVFFVFLSKIMRTFNRITRKK